MNNLPAHDICNAFSYCQLTGILRWKIKPARHIKVGAIAGSKPANEIYWRVRFKRKNYALHRLAWVCVYGAWPTGHIDHINGDATDNRLANLRDVTPAENSQNILKATAKNKLRTLGVHQMKGRNGFRAAIGVAGKVKHLGTFQSEEAAYAAYVTAKRSLHKGSTL